MYIMVGVRCGPGNTPTFYSATASLQQGAVLREVTMLRQDSNLEPMRRRPSCAASEHSSSSVDPQQRDNGQESHEGAMMIRRIIDAAGALPSTAQHCSLPSIAHHWVVHIHRRPPSAPPQLVAVTSVWQRRGSRPSWGGRPRYCGQSCGCKTEAPAAAAHWLQYPNRSRCCGKRSRNY